MSGTVAGLRALLPCLVFGFLLGGKPCRHLVFGGQTCDRARDTDRHFPVPQRNLQFGRQGQQRAPL